MSKNFNKYMRSKIKKQNPLAYFLKTALHTDGNGLILIRPSFPDYDFY